MLREKGKSRRKKRITDAVLSILSQPNGEPITVPQLAAEAEVSVATLYNLIGGLEDIITLAINQGFADYQAPALSKDDSPFEQFGHITDSTYQFLKQDAPYYQAILRQLKQANMPSPIIQALRAQQQLLQEVLNNAQTEELLNSQCNTELLAQQLITVQISLHQNWVDQEVSLDIMHITVRYHFALLLQAWSTLESRASLSEDILFLQNAIAHLQGQEA